MDDPHFCYKQTKILEKNIAIFGKKYFLLVFFFFLDNIGYQCFFTIFKKKANWQPSIGRCKKKW
jgi:hypothetical protein